MRRSSAAVSASTAGPTPSISKRGALVDGISDTSSTAESGLSNETLPLNFGNVDLIGRDAEVDSLRAAYARLRYPGALSEMILVRGESGVGKTQLIKHSLETFVDRQGGFFCSGKSDQYESISRPYGVVSEVITSLCTMLAHQEDLAACRRRLDDALTKEERQLLLRFILAIGTVFDETIQEAIDDPVNEFAFRRFALVLRTYLDAVATEQAPVVVFFDDIQWADAGSRDLVSRLASGKSTNVLFIVAVRDDDERTFEMNEKEMDIPLTTLRVASLSQVDINSLVATLLEQSVDRTVALSELVYHRTQGNVYFVVQFLELLHRERYVQFSFASGRWEWNLEQIQVHTSVSENVATLLASKIACLSEEVQRILMVAACLGFSFSAETLKEIAINHTSIWNDAGLSDHHGVSDSERGTITIDDVGFFRRRFDDALTKARKMDLIQQLATGRYRFSHDRVQQSLISMIPSGPEGMRLYRRLGELIRDSYNDAQAPDERNLYTAVDLLDRGRYWEQDDACAAEFAALCTDATFAAYRKSAFLSAGGYADKAIRVLDRKGKGWTDHYDKCLELYTLSAKMHYSYGDLERCGACTQEILQYGRSAKDKRNARYIRIGLLATTRERMLEAVHESVLLCRELGLPMKVNPSKIDVLVIFWKTKRLLKGRKAVELQGLPLMQDESVLEMMRILSSLVFFSYQARQKEHLFFANITMMYLTLKHGISPYSPVGFTAYGGMIGHFGDLQNAYEFGALALDMARKPEFRVSTPRTNLIGHTFLHHLKMPFQSSLKPILRAYRVGMELGETEFAAAALRMHACLAVVIGMPLQSLEQQVDGYCSWFKDYSHTSTLVIVLPWLQLAQNLQGKSKDSLKLTGAAMDEDALMHNFEKTGDLHGVLNLRYTRLLLCYILGDFRAADVERLALAKSKDMDGTHLMKIFSTFFSGLTCLALARWPRGRRYRHQANGFIKEMRKYVASGSVNGAPMLTLMTAEFQALGRKGGRDAVAVYDRAIVMAARCGFRLMKGIACERAGVHLIACDDKEAASDYLRNAYGEYLEYGATEKLAVLEKSYSFVDFSTVEARQSSVLALKTFVPEPRSHLAEDSSECMM